MKWNLIFVISVISPACLASPFSVDVDAIGTDKLDTLYFGFFFDEPTAKTLKHVTDLYFNQTISHFPEFLGFLQNITTKAGLSSIYDYFQKPLDPNTGEYDPLYHVTAKYCGNNQTACDEYEKKNRNFINQTFEMHLTGYVITNRTFGIRVNLTGEQLQLFDNEEGKKTSSSPAPVEFTFQLGPQPYSNIRLESQDPFPPSLPVTSTRAHATLGCAPGIPAVITGPDALKVIALEKSNPPIPPAEVKTVSFDDPADPEGRKMDVKWYRPNGTATSPEDFIFVIYPRVNVIANATLTNYFQKASSSASPSTSLLNYFSYHVFRENSTLVMIASVFVHFFRQ